MRLFPFVLRKHGAPRRAVSKGERPESWPALAFPSRDAGLQDEPRGGLALAYADAVAHDRPLAWGASLSAMAHVIVFALAIALVSVKPEIELPSPIPVEIVYATSPSPAPAVKAAPTPPRPARTPPVPAEVATPKRLPRPAETPKPPAPDGLALPESNQARRFVPPPPPERPKFVPPNPARAPVVEAKPQSHFEMFAPGFKPPPPATAAPTRAAPSIASAGRASPRTTPPVYAAADLGNRPPIYPLTAREHGWQGHVLLRADVTARGTLNDVTVEKSSGYDALDEAALVAVRHWRFHPARENGVPVRSIMDIGFTFRLTGEE